MNKNPNSADVRCLTRPTQKAWKSLGLPVFHFKIYQIILWNDSLLDKTPIEFCIPVCETTQQTLPHVLYVYMFSVSVFFGYSVSNIHWKLGQQRPTLLAYLGIKLFLFFNIERWNFQYLLEKESLETSQNFQLIQVIQTIFIFIFSIRCLIESKFCEVSRFFFKKESLNCQAFVWKWISWSLTN